MGKIGNNNERERKSWETIGNGNRAIMQTSWKQHRSWQKIIRTSWTREVHTHPNLFDFMSQLLGPLSRSMRTSANSTAVILSTKSIHTEAENKTEKKTEHYRKKSEKN